jgi:CDP-glycerol glycerophosphotransferase (TagB/SpsB family)
MIFKEIIRKSLNGINRLLPKFNRILIVGAPNADSQAIAVANYISQHYKLPIIYSISNTFKDDPHNLLAPAISTVHRTWDKWPSIKFILKFMTSKYIFITQNPFLYSFPDKQIVTNLWHGVGHKKIGLLGEGNQILADITITTSQATREMFSQFFGVPKKSVYAYGYPRNDMLLNASRKRNLIKKRISDLSSFQKIAIWMPTYRKHALSSRTYGKEVQNSFYIEDFDIDYFNGLLKKYNTLCLVKPHFAALTYKSNKNLSNVQFIDDKWITQQDMTLYQLIGCTDFLISDVSSVMIDYMLLDQPIICVSTDFEEYGKTMGFYFDDIENWIPSRINKNQASFFSHLNDVLNNRTDTSKEKRERLKSYFFDDYDSHSTERIVNHVLKNEV